tara:strand:+ start:23 stop:496 length:474 start_codon:yes stop_codon:yes gene_type:complete
MKILIIIVFFYVFKLQTATWIEESVGNIISYEKMHLPDGSVYSISKGTGGGKDNTGKYVSSECIGHRLEKNNSLIELKFFCNVELSNGDKYYFMQYRTKSDTDVGVGKGTILGGTGIFSKLIGTKCLYGIKHLKKNVYTTTKCEIPDNIFSELKNDN